MYIFIIASENVVLILHLYQTGTIYKVQCTNESIAVSYKKNKKKFENLNSLINKSLSLFIRFNFSITGGEKTERNYQLIMGLSG